MRNPENALERNKQNKMYHFRTIFVIQRGSSSIQFP